MPLAPSGEQVELALGEQRAVVVGFGGGLRSYAVAGRDLLDGYAADEMSASGRGQVLIPWPNRVQGGSYEFGGRTHQLSLDEPAAGNAIHGLVRWADWTVAEREREPRRAGAHVASAAGLSVHPGGLDRVRAVGARASRCGRRRRTSVRIRARSEPAPIPT